MPLSSNPRKTTPFWLTCDADEPLATRPVLLVRFMTVDQHETHRELVDQAHATSDHAEAYRLVREAMAVGLAGWRNFAPKDESGKEPPFSIESLFAMYADRLLTQTELWAIAWNYPGAVKLCEADLKNSV
jgi:hypothetical protein